MLEEGWKAWNLDSGSCRTFTASCARKSRITIVLSENCSFRPLRFSLMWCRGTLSSPAHRRFASSAETEVHTGASARSRGSTVRPGRASENRSGRLLVAYSSTHCVHVYVKAAVKLGANIYAACSMHVTLQKVCRYYEFTIISILRHPLNFFDKFWSVILVI